MLYGVKYKNFDLAEALTPPLLILKPTWRANTLHWYTYITVPVIELITHPCPISFPLYHCYVLALVLLHTTLLVTKFCDTC